MVVKLCYNLSGMRAQAIRSALMSHDWQWDYAIDALAKCGTLERRADTRQPISFAAEAKAELGTEFNPVEIIDISDGGFCLLADGLAVAPGDRLLIKMNQADVGTRLVRARIATKPDAADNPAQHYRWQHSQRENPATFFA